MGFIKKYNQEITLGLFCVGMLCYALGLSSFGKSLKTQTFFHIGGLLFIIYNYRLFSRALWKILSVPICCFVIVCLLGILTIFDDVWVRQISVVLKSVNQHIVGYFVLFVSMFLFGMYGKAKNVFFFLAAFVLLCVLEVCSTICLGLKNGLLNTDNIPFFFQVVFTYNIWLIAPASMSLAGVFAFKKWTYKILSFIGLILSLFAMLANGERSFLVAFVGMLFIPFFVWQYKHKLKVLLFVLCIGITFVIGFYHASKSFSDRYNFAHMIDNFVVVWNTNPIEMGQYDKLCFSKHIECSHESLILGQNEITWEHSSLSRINMTKSTLLAVADSPFKPHIVGVFQIGEYLWRYYSLKNHQNRSYINFENNSNNMNMNGYNHPHNFAVSLLFSYGVIGFVCIVIFQFFLLYSGYRCMQKQEYRWKSFWGLSLIIFVCGICIQSLFDALYPQILQCIFIWCGVVVGLGWRDENLTNNQ
ncbi:O-antigen ligase family protein [Helicobacter labetoulli]|uniref:O-antigen ligase family protein n=2 Tax=Helicobacter labetoulli TaxID=2315333 RepID=UPI000EF6EA56|nr:O-antigen ligase family protein [Helicobacter labetoulli]